MQINSFVVPNVKSGLLKKITKQPIEKLPTPSEQGSSVPSEMSAFFESKEQPKFYCPEEGCVKVYRYRRFLDQHLDVGKHNFKLHEESQYDNLRRKWAQKCTSVKAPNPTSLPVQGTTSHSSARVPMGWALPKSKQGKRFSLQVKTFLLEQFMIGEETGLKVTPQETSKRMRSMRDSKGKKVFGKEDWLTVQQITSYFSRLASMKKLGSLPLTTSLAASQKEDDNDEVEVVLQTAARYNLRQRVISKLTL